MHASRGEGRCAAHGRRLRLGAHGHLPADASLRPDLGRFDEDGRVGSGCGGELHLPRRELRQARPLPVRHPLLHLLGHFEGFDSYDLCDDGSRVDLDDIDATIRRNDSLQQFVEHSALDPIELMRDFPSCDFANFCQKKYAKLIHPGIESPLLRNLATVESPLGSLRQTSPYSVR
ncbi:hypothetical protein MUK42_02637 [Musa troglodytarum]|uniref:Uncharacterized protein n=1 Tax=Musa troglodytarum TaxID=320322 RepID=A0A9E7EKH5_9LILI|nr:hypothetical protein MUK42_02637 [Musa troglodytarum]